MKRFNVFINKNVYDQLKGHLAAQGKTISGWIRVLIANELNISEEEVRKDESER